MTTEEMKKLYESEPENWVRYGKHRYTDKVKVQKHWRKL